MEIMLTDLDELLERTHNLTSKKHINEAIISYRAGAFRSAIISSWIAVCVDIIEKIKELNTSEDSEAKIIVERLDKISPSDVKAMLNFENELLEMAHNKFEFISFIEKSHLERLKEDRNICAHPNFSAENMQFNPSAELVRSYIVQVVSYLLQNIPIKGKVVLDQLFNLIEEQSFPKDEEQAFRLLSSNQYLGKVKIVTIRNLIIMLLKRLLIDKDGLKFSYVEKIASALSAISRINPKVYKEVIDDKLNVFLAKATDIRLKRGLVLLSYRDELQSSIDNEIKIRFENLIEYLDVKDLIKYRVSNIATYGFMFDTIINKINKLSIDEKEDLLEKTPSKILKNMAIQLFTESPSFNYSYKVGTNILIPHLKFLELNDIKILLDEIIKNKTNNKYNINQILDAGGMDEVFCSLFNELNPKIMDKKIWLNFWDNIKKQGSESNFDEFKSLLEDNKII
jgi:hypothetical protein